LALNKIEQFAENNEKMKMATALDKGWWPNELQMG
jgi:hypothetical protein